VGYPLPCIFSKVPIWKAKWVSSGHRSYRLPAIVGPCWCQSPGLLLGTYLYSLVLRALLHAVCIEMLAVRYRSPRWFRIRPALESIFARTTSGAHAQENGTVEGGAIDPVIN